MQMTYDIWAIRINEAIRANRQPEPGDAHTRKTTPFKQKLLAFASEAEMIAGAIGRHVEDLDILGADRFDTLDGFLDQMMTFDDFVYLEYRYKMPSPREPGLRFKVGGQAQIIAVHYFRDLVFWEVDERERRIFMEPVQFHFSKTTIKAIPHKDLAAAYAGCTTWQTALRETLTLPFRHLYDHAFLL